MNTYSFSSRKILFLVPILLAFSTSGLAQVTIIKNKKYKINTNIQVKRNSPPDGCSTQFSICVNSKIEVTEVNGDVATLKVIKLQDSCNPPVFGCGLVPGETFNVNVDSLESAVNKSPWDVSASLMTVPFKFNLDNSEIFAGGTIGGAIGPKYRLFYDKEGRPFSVFLAFSGGFSSIPLNTVGTTSAQEAVESVGALTLGGAVGISYGTFTFTVVRGVDQYNIEGIERDLNWFSIGIGIDFVSVFTSEK